MGTYELLGISFIAGVGRKTLEAYINYLSQNKLSPQLHFSSVSDIFSDIRETNKKVKVPSRDDFDQALFQLETTWEKSENGGVRVLSMLDPHFPQRLRNIPDPPIFLHYKGNINSYQKKCVAIIGTREPSEHAVWAGRRMSDYFVKAGFTIVSGLAKGCDTIGHLAAVESQSETIAILAGGLQDIYPKENKGLAERILDNGGLLLSEYEWGRPSNKNYFVERDRLQSGLSEGIIVLETGIKGGTRHTVAAAFKQKRLIGCLYTHPLYNLTDTEKFQGNIDIVNKEGGIKLHDKDSITDFITALESRFIAGRLTDNKTNEAESEAPRNASEDQPLQPENGQQNKGSQATTQLSLYNEGSNI